MNRYDIALGKTPSKNLDVSAQELELRQQILAMQSTLKPGDVSEDLNALYHQLNKLSTKHQNKAWPGAVILATEVAVSDDRLYSVDEDYKREATRLVVKGLVNKIAPYIKLIEYTDPMNRQTFVRGEITIFEKEK